MEREGGRERRKPSRTREDTGGHDYRQSHGPCSVARV